MTVGELAAVDWLAAGEHPEVAAVNGIPVRLAQERQPVLGGDTAAGAPSAY